MNWKFYLLRSLIWMLFKLRSCVYQLLSRATPTLFVNCSFRKQPLISFEYISWGFQHWRWFDCWLIKTIQSFKLTTSLSLFTISWISTVPWLLLMQMIYSFPIQRRIFENFCIYTFHQLSYHYCKPYVYDYDD